MNDLYIKYSDVIPIDKNRELTRGEKKIYDLGFFDCSEKAEAYAEQKVREFADRLKSDAENGTGDIEKLLDDCVSLSNSSATYLYLNYIDEVLAEWQKTYKQNVE